MGAERPDVSSRLAVYTKQNKAVGKIKDLNLMDSADSQLSSNRTPSRRALIDSARHLGGNLPQGFGRNVGMKP